MTSASPSPSARPLRATLLMDTRAWAGTESHVLTLARALRDHAASNSNGGDGMAVASDDDGIAVEVTVACPPGSPLWERARAAGLPTLAIARHGVWDAGTLQTLARRVRRGACDVIHAHNGRTALWAALAVRAAGRGKAVFTHHFIEPAHAQTGQNGGAPVVGALKKRVHLRLARGIAGHIAISQAVADAIGDRGEVEQARLHVVPNGINAPDAVDPSALPDALRAEIACVARLQEEKDIPTLVRAMRILQAARPDNAPRCTVAGEGDEREALQELIEAQGVAEVMHLAGFTPHVGALLQSARVAVLPSPAEPFGLAIIEAMAHRRAVVAVDAGGPREIVVPGQTGLLVPPHDPQALAHALGELLDDPARAEQMGAAGFARYQTHFTAARMARQTAEVYQKGA